MPDIAKLNSPWTTLKIGLLDSKTCLNSTKLPILFLRSLSPAEREWYATPASTMLRRVALVHRSSGDQCHLLVEACCRIALDSQVSTLKLEGPDLAGL